MSRKQEQRLARCDRKINYATWDDAECASLRVWLEAPETDANMPLPYPCEVIGERHYHIGHIRPSQKKRRRAGGEDG